VKILIIGASGLVGSNCRSAFLAQGHEIIGTYSRFALPELLPLDAQDEPAICALMEKVQPEVVVNCAAWSWVDGCENDPGRAFALNARQPEALCQAAQSAGARFVHFSTSYVFDGENAPYDETAAPCPISVYGKSKLAGETAVVQVSGGSALVIRTMGVYGEEPQRKNFVYQVVDKLRRGERMKVPNDQFGNASYAADLADGLLRLLEAKHAGIWNLAGPEPELRRDVFALRIADAYGLSRDLFDFVSTAELRQAAPRPLRAGLKIDRAIAELGWQPHPWVSLL
jgi:dTDP-4-dehydrorhamnose reductase